MKTILLAAGALAVALTAGQALAARSHHASATAAEPKQPIPYAELGAYLKASPTQRAKKDWWSQASLGAEASTGTSANTAASAPARTPSTPPSLGGGTSAAPSPPSTPPVATPPASDTTPPSTETAPGQPVNPPPK